MATQAQHTTLTPAGLQIPHSIESTRRPLPQKNTLKIGRELFNLQEQTQKSQNE